MKSKGKKTGFSIVELLTVMSIIMILLSILIPSLAAVRRYAKVVKQKAMFSDIGKGLEMFRVDYEDYPESSWNDPNDESYCGAMKLCEAMVGQDGLGYHPDSIFDYLGRNGVGDPLYFISGWGNNLSDPPTPQQKANLRNRKVYLEGEEVQVASIAEIFKVNGPGQFDQYNTILCDVFKRVDLKRIGGTKLGMPILYYRADTTKLTHDPEEMATNIYNYWDNDELLEIIPNWITDPNETHPLYDNGATASDAGTVFYPITTNPEVIVKMGTETFPQPYNKNSYILISAGHDGLYGTRDDVFNFDKK